MYKKIILGSAQFGMKYGIANTKGKITSNEVFKILNYIKRENINFIDTARSYHSSEKAIGKYYKKTKKKFLIITKFSYKNNKNIKKQFEESFEALGYIPDTILAHNYKDYLNPNFHKEIKMLKKFYPIKKVGVSLYSVPELIKILKYKKPDVIQVPINILDKRFITKKIIKKLKQKSIKIIGRSIFLQGLFFKNINYVFKKFKNVKNKYNLLIEINKNKKMTLGELALNWAYHLKDIDNIVIGVDSLSHLKKNLQNIKKKLTKKTYDKIYQINLNKNKIIKPYLWKIKQ